MIKYSLKKNMIIYDKNFLKKSYLYNFRIHTAKKTNELEKTRIDSFDFSKYKFK